MQLDPSAFARAMKVKRAERGWNQQDLSKASNVPMASIARYETGMHTPGLDKACAIANAFGCSLDEMVKTKHRSFTSARRSR